MLAKKFAKPGIGNERDDYGCGCELGHGFILPPFYTRDTKLRLQYTGMPPLATWEIPRGYQYCRMDDDARQLLRERRYREALECLLDRYEGKVFRMALAILKDPAHAEEVTQDIFFKIWQAFPDYDERAAPGTWLYTIARNTCLSAARAASYRRTVPLDSGPEPAAGVPYAG